MWNMRGKWSKTLDFHIKGTQGTCHFITKYNIQRLQSAVPENNNNSPTESQCNKLFQWRERQQLKAKVFTEKYRAQQLNFNFWRGGMQTKKPSVEGVWIYIFKPHNSVSIMVPITGNHAKLKRIHAAQQTASRETLLVQISFLFKLFIASHETEKM